MVDNCDPNGRHSLVLFCEEESKNSASQAVSWLSTQCCRGDPQIELSGAEKNVNCHKSVLKVTILPEISVNQCFNYID